MIIHIDNTFRNTVLTQILLQRLNVCNITKRDLTILTFGTCFLEIYIWSIFTNGFVHLRIKINKIGYLIVLSFLCIAVFHQIFFGKYVMNITYNCYQVTYLTSV